MKRISAYISEELFLQIDQMAKAETRSVNSMITILLEKAIKEKLRKRKPNNEEDNS